MIRLFAKKYCSGSGSTIGNIKWAGYTLSLLLPLTTLAFGKGGPWPWWQALVWTIPVWLLIIADYFSPSLRCVPPSQLPDWPFEGLLYVLCMLQPLNIYVVADMIARTRWGNSAEIIESLTNLVAVRILAGTTSCCAAIAPAHELIHRRSKWKRQLGRMLLCTVLYDHFAIVHNRLHHKYVNTLTDPSYAKMGDRYEPFFRRTVRLQWHAAWAMDPIHTLYGVGIEVLLLIGISSFFGPLSLILFLYQAVAAVRLLEAVNYFQHKGLERGGPSAWHCDSAISLFLFIGLPRHDDHHRHALTPYHKLISNDHGGRLRYGYLITALLVKNRFDTSIPTRIEYTA